MQTAVRRLVTVPGYVLAWVVWIACVPVWAPLALLTDAVRRSRGMAIRSGAVLGHYLTCEVAGIVISSAAYCWRLLARPAAEDWRALHLRLESWWGSTIYRGVVRIFSLRVEVTGQESLAAGPYILLMRHASTADTLLAAALVSRPHGVALRYVLKKELLWDPCLDIVGQRVPNVFVDREAADGDAEVVAVSRLAADLGPRDGVLIYPEGTRFTPEKRARILQRLRERGDDRALAHAEALRHVLPPRPRGTLALLDAAPGADVVIGAHTGFESARSLASIWRGELIGRRIRVHFRRVARAALPASAEDRAEWLRAEWQALDEWVEENAT